MRIARFILCGAVLTGCSHAPVGSPLPPAGPSVFISQSSNFQTLYRFTNPADGAIPVGSLLGSNGALFGTTYQGGYGKPGLGVVYELGASGAENAVYTFTNSTQGKGPYAGLTDVNGTFYGTTQEGGTYDEGTVFSLTASGTENVLFSFNGTDGSYPRAGLTNVNGVLYGTTYYGGADAYGTVFSITTGTTGATETVLHSFKSGSDGALPLGALIYVKNELYGTTSLGGPSDDGTVFKITLAGKEEVVYRFEGGSDGDGAQPFAGLTELNGNLYGTTYEGGANDLGTVFEIDKRRAEKVLYSFAGGEDGANPYAGITLLNGIPYGNTSRGGSGDYGTIYTITPSGGETVLYNFTGGKGGKIPYASMTAIGGALYGTTLFNGGTIFEFTPPTPKGRSKHDTPI